MVGFGGGGRKLMQEARFSKVEENSSSIEASWLSCSRVELTLRLTGARGEKGVHPAES